MVSWSPRDPFAQERHACIHDLIASNARRHPDAEAVCGWDGILTYKEVDGFSNIAAAELRIRGVKAGTYVPFACGKTIWAVVISLGILKAGGALVPLNPNDPVARLEEIVMSVQANVIATTESLASMFRPLVKHVMIFPEETSNSSGSDHIHTNRLITPQEDQLYNSTVSPSDPIFVLFTSGSTGRPKGMIHTHSSITTHALTHGAAMSYQGARVLQFAAYTFDVALIDIFTTLLFGDCICVPSESDRKSNIVDVMNDMRVDYAILTPSFAGLIDPAEVPMLKTLAVGGEALPQDRIKRWADKVNLLQIYGPAEVGICLIATMQRDTPGALVGFPLDNSSCWLVDPDDDSRLVPIGAVGELLVAGPSLARGYLNDEARTQLSFIGAPAWASRLKLPFNCFYKTGDLLRWNVDAFDGSFVFVGRKDSQIKLRGQRIEAGEVEHHIGHLPRVAFSVVAKPDKGCFAGQLIVVIQTNRADDSRARLVDADIQLAEVQDPKIEEVKRKLERVLPAYMIPTECLVVRYMPFVPSLKIDRRRVYSWLTNMGSRPSMKSIPIISLLRPEETTANVLSNYIARTLTIEDEQRHQLKTHDFILQSTGIDSIKVISLTMFLRKEYGITIPMDALLSSQTTVRELASWIDSRTTESIDVPCSAAVSTPFQTRILNADEESIALRKALVKEIKAETSIPIATRPYRRSQNILLTGASGYLGSAILHQLLRLPHVHVFAATRCTDSSTGLQNLKGIGIKDGWWCSDYEARITVWPSDLSSPNLGLSSTHQHQLTPPAPKSSVSIANNEETPPIDTIIHAGAKVHYTLPYTTLFPTNVSSTLTLLRSTALSPHLHTFIHISGGESPDIDSISTDAEYLNSLGNASGYTLTKNIAERFVRAAAGDTRPSSSSNLNAALADKRIKVVKPGYIIGSPLACYRANTTDFLWRLLAGCVEIGAYNADEANRWVFVDDVASVAARVVDGIAVHGDYAGDDSAHVERILTGLRFGAVVQVLEEVYGRRFEAMEGERWMRELKERVVEKGEGGVLFPLWDVLEKERGRVGVEREEGEREGVERMRMVVEGNVRWLVEIGFLPAVGGDGAMAGEVV